MKLFIYGIAVGYFMRPIIERLWSKLNDKLDEWAGL
jgi:hypothetical protein